MNLGLRININLNPNRIPAIILQSVERVHCDYRNQFHLNLTKDKASHGKMEVVYTL